MTSVRGNLETVSRFTIQGWIQDVDAPKSELCLEIFNNGALIAQITANQYREDLERARVGCGRHGFTFNIPGGLSPLISHVLHIRLKQDDTDVPGSPVVIEAATSFDNGLEEAVSDAISALEEGKPDEQTLLFMIAQAERLREKQGIAVGEACLRPKSTCGDSGSYSATNLPSTLIARGMPPRLSKLRALVLDRYMPVEGQDAGSEVILSHIRALQRLGYVVSFSAVEDMIVTGQALPMEHINWCGAPVYGSVEEVLRRQQEPFDLIYLHRVSVADCYLELARAYCPLACLIYSVADLHHLRLSRQAEIDDRYDLEVESLHIRGKELYAAERADGVITHSLYEQALLQAALPQALVGVVPWDNPVRQQIKPFVARHGLALIGCYGHEPNIDAAHYLVEQIMPLVWKRDASITCFLVGPGAPPSVQLLSSDRVLVTGRIEDLGIGVWDKVRLTVAPLRFGAGIKGKVLQSFAAGIPCAMSRVASEGLALPAVLQNLIADDPAQMANLIYRLHSQEDVNQAMGIAEQMLVRQRFSADATEAGLKSIIENSMTVARSRASMSDNRPSRWRSLRARRFARWQK